MSNMDAERAKKILSSRRNTLGRIKATWYLEGMNGPDVNALVDSIEDYQREWEMPTCDPLLRRLARENVFKALAAFRRAVGK